MPKVNATNSSKLRQIVSEYGDKVFSTDNKVLLCLLCSKKVNHSKKYFIDQHINTAKHEAAVALQKTSKVQFVSSFTENTNVGNVFLNDFTKMMVACDIPLHKLKQPEFKNFFSKYTGRKLPEESTVRKNYVNKLYENVIAEIRRDVGDSCIYISIDETTDKQNRALCNVVVGSLRKNGRGFLIASEVIDKVNASEIATVFDSALNVLWPEKVQREKVLVFITDAAPYMIKSGKALKVLYPKMIHITCIAHGVHRLCERIRSNFPEVDKLLSNGKKLFVKCNSRVALFKEKHPELPLPPKPVITRWGTWLEAAVYYARHFEEFKSFVDELNDDSSSIKFTKEVLNNDAVRPQLAYIMTAFGFLGGILTKLQKRGTPIDYGIKILEAVENELKDARGPVGEDIRNKYISIVLKNKDLIILKKINEVVAGSTSQLPPDISVKDVDAFNWAPLVSVEVERTFSCFKAMLRDNRRSMLPENYTKHLIALCFYNSNDEIIEI